MSKLWGADLNAVDYKGDTPLHYAARKEYDLEIYSFLVELGADLNIKNNKGKILQQILEYCSSDSFSI